uniref:Uncharacterized protein n=1 Tax=Raoultella ornithinolytica TaxID=54291 RepID=A0A0M4L6T3_RAOOR|nr:hypothetical protein [Raoultella ornithinolytica]
MIKYNPFTKNIITKGSEGITFTIINATFVVFVVGSGYFNYGFIENSIQNANET